MEKHNQITLSPPKLLILFSASGNVGKTSIIWNCEVAYSRIPRAMGYMERNFNGWTCRNKFRTVRFLRESKSTVSGRHKKRRANIDSTALWVSIRIGKRFHKVFQANENILILKVPGGYINVAHPHKHTHNDHNSHQLNYNNNILCQKTVSNWEGCIFNIKLLAILFILYRICCCFDPVSNACISNDES